MQLTTIIVSAALAAGVLAQPASAEGVRRVSVAYGDLDLSQPREAQMMLDRLTLASHRVCGGSPIADPSYRHARTQVRQAFQTCVTESLSAAVARLDAPLVERAYAATVERPLG